MLKDNQRFNESIKPNSVFLAELSQKLPEFFTAKKYDDEGNIVEEAKFDMEKFQRALKEQNVDELSSGYQIDFIGKNYAKKQAGERSTTVIVPDNEHNEKPENKESKNLFFTGDNLEVLRHLQQNYTDSVDFIYIDPPYNTGSGDFVYPDKFEYSDEQLKDMFGLNDDELKRLKSIQGKSSHSAWLTFIYPRLYLAKKLLRNTGIIFVSIDDNEQANLKLLMDDVFGESSFVANFIWQHRKSSQNDTDVSLSHNYTLAFAKNRSVFRLNTLATDESKFTNSDNDPRGPWVADPFDAPNIRPNLTYPITNPLTGEQHLPPRGRCWRTTQERYTSALADNRIIFGKTGKGRPQMKRFLSEAQKKGTNPFTIWSHVGTATNGTKEVMNLFDGVKVFSNPKPVGLIREMLLLGSQKDATILDFFAGSATTADAVMQLNAEDGGSRRYIMVQLPEPTKPDTVAYEMGYTSIDQISRTRIKKAAAKIQSETPLLTDTQDFGFKHYQVVEPNQQALDKIEYDGNMQLDMFDDMITLFSNKKLGVKGNTNGFDTILQTYLASDNYKFDVSIEMRDFGGIQLPYVNNQRIYIITNDWKANNTKALVNAIGTNGISVQTIVVYGYTMDMESLRELEIALNQLENKVNLLVRY